jgi:peroxiredoxin
MQSRVVACIVGLCIAGVASAATPSEAQRALLVGKRAPDVALNTLEGKTVTLSALAGRVVVLDFWATWCAPCVKMVPRLNAWHRTFAAKGVVIIGIAEDEEDDVRAFAKETKLDYSVVLDPAQDALRKYQPQGLPMMAIIDKSGVIRFAEAGAGELDQVEKMLTALVK